MSLKRPWFILPLIVFSQFAGTSLWFASNAVLPEIQEIYGYGQGSLGQITSSIQFGFIVGTLVFAFLNIADRFSAVRVFLICSLAGSLSNLLLIPAIENLNLVLGLRFLTGIFLAGIYPVGMKISASWYPQGLGKALGFLVGALVIGTAFPHFLNALGNGFSWQDVLYSVSILSALGGIMLAIFVPNGPSHSSPGKFDPAALMKIFKAPKFRAAAFGYFGHMWELYAFWAFVPFFLEAYARIHEIDFLPVPLWSFIIIASGFIGCAGGGILSLKMGSARVAFANLGLSGFLCLLSPLIFFLPPYLFLLSLVIWGITVVGDSPQFSSLTARTAPPELVGSGLTIVNSIGFAITIFSIQLCTYLSMEIPPQYLFLVLIPGPVFGLISIRKLQATAQ